MAKVAIDLTSVQRSVALSAQEVRRLPRRFLAAASRAVTKEKATKTYDNRTGDAVRGTTAILAVGADRFTVTLQMSEPYSSLLIRRGFSNFNDHANAAVGELAFIVGAMGAKISRL